jgi:very-short-patch-repair endonuclease
MNHFVGRQSSLVKHLADARQRLIQTGTRNRLVHTARFSKQGKSIDVVNASSDDVFRTLHADGRRMRFMHDPSVRETKEEQDFELESLSQVDTRFTDKGLQTRFGQTKLQKKLLGISREAKTLEEEQGINALYLAVGFLRWFEDERSEVERMAPLVLLPVSLKRNERTSTYDLEARGEDITTNEPLKHRLTDDFGIRLPDIPDEEDWAPSDYFASVQEAISGQSRWSIDENGLQVGFFSFAKLLMVKDLEPENWPNDITSHPILAGLLVDGFAPEADDFPETGRLDSLFSPEELIQVVDADASQTLVIETVRKGRNLVVQGPPGTGKSQTITNIIAAAAHDGKSVLFVAEKMAALDVVHDRLKNNGLRDICLELHSRSANKRLVAEELGRTLGVGGASVLQGDANELTRLRDKLNGIAEVMHRSVGDTGITPYRAISTLIRLNEDGFVPTDLKLRDVATWTKARLDEVLGTARNLAEVTAKAGPSLSHPFFGVRRHDLLPTDRARLKPKLEAILGVIANADKSAALLSEKLGFGGNRSSSISAQLGTVVELIIQLSPAAMPFASAIAAHGGLDKAASLAEAGELYLRHSAAAASIFQPTAVAAKIDHVRAMLATGSGFFGRLGSSYRNGSSELASLLLGQLPRKQADRINLLDKLFELQQVRTRLLSLEVLGIELLGSSWRGDMTDFASLSQATNWLRRVLQNAIQVNTNSVLSLAGDRPEQLRSLQTEVTGHSADVSARFRDIVAELELDFEAVFGVSEAGDIPFVEMTRKARLWLEDLERLDEWSHLARADASLRELAGDNIADAVGTGEIMPDQLRNTIRHAHAEAIYRKFAASEAWATNLTAAEKDELAGNFRSREKARRSAVAKLIQSNHIAGLPRGGMGAMGLVRAEIGKKRGHKPIRKLMSEAGSVIQQIKPVLLMSPISIAQYLPPGAIEFDLLVIDEASQVRPEDAIGAIIRAKQIVVVGDKRQLPPTSFFDRIVSDVEEQDPEEEAEIPAPAVTSATALESILTLCEARGLPSRMLRWHYRSKHPSLISVSNELFYSDNGGLILFPSPAATRETDGLVLTRVNGAYDRGGKRNNVKEAEAVAQAVAEHSLKHPTRSLGVVTFSTAQRDAISERLAALRQTHRGLDAFMREGEREEFFVKNIENVQGDERDVILISVGYGPRIAGAPLDSMAFGPVSTEGGERRLNVLFTRARYRTHVFASFKSSDINLERSKSVGARVLKQFLYYAETGDSVSGIDLGADPDSDFEVSVASEIRRLGYTVDYQVGSAGFKIDLAVHRPDQEGRYMLAVECDGATYHSAVWARECDRLRQEVLEGLGWRFHRVWSTDWFHRRSQEVRRLEAALTSATNYQPAAKAVEDLIFEQPETDPVQAFEAGAAFENLPDYVLADFAVPAIEPHEVPLNTMGSVVQRIIDIEGPIHQEELGRRVANLFGKQKAGSRIADAVGMGARHLCRNNPNYFDEAGFWTSKAIQGNVPLRNRSRAPLSLRKAQMLPPAEIAVAIRRVISENGALSLEALPRATALLFGFQRTGPEFRPAIVPVAQSMIVAGELRETSAGIELAQ